MGKIKAGVVVVTEFCKPDNQMFQGYINYMDRDEAVRNAHIDEYNVYQDYMGNPYKTTGLFTQDKSRLSEKEKQELKEQFSMAQDNKSLMWQTVISFDNEWLRKQGLWNGYLSTQNEQKLQGIIRKSVNEMLEKENLQNAVWSAAFHLNTDNLHVHIAIVEPIPMREKKAYPVYKTYTKNGKVEQVQVGSEMEYKGRFKLSSIEACKSAVVNEIVNTREQNLEINRVIRESIVQKKRETALQQDEELGKAFFSLYEKMPDCKRSLWNYNNSKMSHLKGEIDALSNAYLKKYHKKDYEELKEKLMKQDASYREAYGESKSSYLDGKIEDLYTRLGNAILKEIKEYDKNKSLYIPSVEKENKEDVHVLEREHKNVYLEKKEQFEDEELTEIIENELTDSSVGKYTEGISKKIEWSKEYRKAKDYLYGKNRDYEKAKEILLEEHKKENILATYELGNLYQYGLGTETNLEAAQDYYKKSLDGFKSVYECVKNPGEDKRKVFLKQYSAYRIGKQYERGLGTEQNYFEAYNWFSKSALEGNGYAQYALGNLYYFGKGTEQSYEEAFHCYSNAKDVTPYAQYKIAFMKEEGIGTEVNLQVAYQEYKEALEKFLILIEKNPDADLHYRIGKMYLDGKGTEVNKEQARYHIELAAEGKNPYAQYTLASMMLENNEDIEKAKMLLEKAALEGNFASAQYAMGKLTEEDINVSLKWYKMASDNGNGYASYRIGKLYQNETEIKNINYARQYFEKAIEQGNEAAYYDMGKIYLEEGELKRAESYFLKASEKGNIYADYRLGKMYVEEKEMKNIKKGIEYLAKAAEQDNEEACVYLGYVYLQKETRNIKKSMEYLEKAAMKNNPYAEYMIGEIYLKEYGNKRMAKKYFQKSSESGNEYAKIKLENMKKWEHSSMKRRSIYNTQKAINGLKRALDNSYESYKNQREYEKVLEEQRRERSSQREISV